MSKKELVEKVPTTQPKQKSSLEKLGILLGGIFLIAFIVALSISILVWNQVTSFASKAGTTPQELLQLVEEGLATQLETETDDITFLLLGLDSLDTRPGSPALTDTILLAKVSPKEGKVYLLSLPRDLWSNAYQTRINALYHYGQERALDNPAQFPTEVLEKLLDIQIHYTLVVSLDVVEQVIESVDGVSVSVPEGFTDNQFPRTDVDVTQVRDPALLYETITFEEGEQDFTAEQALKYIRSRYSSGDAGTDIARSQRQQDVIKSLSEKIFSSETLTDVDRLAKIFKVYQNTAAEHISIPEIIAIFRHISQYEPDTLEIVSNTLSIYPDDPDGVIENPPTWKTNGEWIYEVRDIDAFRVEVKEKLGD